VADLQAQVGRDSMCVRGVCFRGDGLGRVSIESADGRRKVAFFNLKGPNDGGWDAFSIHPLVEAFESYYFYLNRNREFGNYGTANQPRFAMQDDTKLRLPGNLCISGDGMGHLFVEDCGVVRRVLRVSLNPDDTDRVRVYMDFSGVAPYAFINGPKRTMGIYTADSAVTSVFDRGVCIGSDKTCLVAEGSTYIWVQDYAGTMQTMRVAATDARDMLRIYSSAAATPGQSRRYFYFNNNGDSSWNWGV
jgi:hypothetical protein